MSLSSQSDKNRTSEDRNVEGIGGSKFGSMAMHVIVMAICTIGIVLTFQFDEVPEPLRRGMAPESFPRGVAVLALVLSFMSMLRSLRSKAEKKDRLPLLFYISLLGCVVFLLVANFVDLLIAMALFVASICWLWGERCVPLIVAMALILPVVIFLLFSELLGIRFPQGIIIDQLYG